MDTTAGTGTAGTGVVLREGGSGRVVLVQLEYGRRPAARQMAIQQA